MSRYRAGKTMRGKTLATITIERNLHQAVAKLEPRHLAHGRAWYPAAQQVLEGMSLLHGIEVERLAYAAAACSPGLSWAATLETLILLLDAHDAGEPMPRGIGHLTFGYRGRERAWAIITTAVDPATLARGPKVAAFAAALLGDLDALPIDRHIVRAATGADVWQLTSRRHLDRIRTAFAFLAAARGMRAAELQAALWVAATGGEA